MDEQTLNINRFEAEGRANFDRWSVALMYGNYAPQADLGYLTRREGCWAGGSIKVGGELGGVGSRPMGSGSQQAQSVYHRGRVMWDDCFVLAANYVTSLTSTPQAPPRLCSATRLCCRSACGHLPTRPHRPARPAASSSRPALTLPEDHSRVSDPVRIGLI